jgi:hypothetical protein
MGINGVASVAIETIGRKPLRLKVCSEIAGCGPVWIREIPAQGPTGNASSGAKFRTREWALVASIGDDDRQGVVPIQYRLPETEATRNEIKAVHERILETALRTQNYDRGLEKFVRKYENLEAMSATLAIQEGWQGDHGWVIFVKQGPKRALLLDTVDGLSAEEVLWTALECWAVFKPRSERVRKFPGRIYYPDQFSHIIQKYWNHLFCLPSHPDFVKESPICQERMAIFSEAMRKFKRTKNWAPQPCAEAPEKGLRIAQEAA